MREKRLNKNQDLHWGNYFEEIFAPLKAPSLGVLVFRRAWGNFFAHSLTFDVERWRSSKKNLCLASHGALKHDVRGIDERPNAKKLCLASNFWWWNLEAKCIFFALGHSSRAPKHVEPKFFCLNLSWNLRAQSSKASRKVEANFLALAKLLKNS
jgi:hypothetical protein